MKRISMIFSLVLAMFISTSHVQAQDAAGAHTNEGIRFGLRAGLNASTIGSSGQSVTFRFGPHFGPYLHMGITERFAIQPELLYSWQGADFADQGQGDQSQRLDYLLLPVYLKFYPSPRFNIHVGPYAGLLLNVYSGGSADVDIRANYHGLDYGLSGGVMYDMIPGFNVGARYNLGLAGIGVDADANNTGNGTGTATFAVGEGAVNHVIQLFIGFTF